MFAQYEFIEEAHKVALESTIRNHHFLTQQLAVKLYKTALDAAKGKVTPEAGLLVSRVDNAKLALGTCTDTRTGVFVQIVRLADDGQVLLTVGQRWVVESTDAATGTSNINYW